MKIVRHPPLVAVFILVLLVMTGIVAYWLKGLAGFHREQMKSDISSATPPRVSPMENKNLEHAAIVEPDGLSKRARDLLVIGRRDLPEAIEFISHNYPEGGRETAYAFLMAELSKENLEATRLMLPLFRSSTERRLAIGMVADYWAGRDASALLDFADKSLDISTKNDVYEKVTQGLVRRKAYPEASKVIDRMPYSAARTSAIESMGHQFGMVDGFAAGKWALGMKLDEDLQSASKAILRGMASAKDLDAMQKFIEIAPPSMKRYAEHEIGQVAGAMGAEALLKLTDSAGSDVVIGGAINSLPLAQLPSMSERVLAIKDKAIRGQTVATYTARLFEMEPRSAIVWVNTTPSDDRPAALGGLVSRWYNTDSEGLSDWINTLQAGRDKDLALSVLVSQLKRTDRKAATEVASAIQDATMKHQAMQSLKH